MVNPDAIRFSAESSRGHFESYYIRGNHPTRPLAFWVRYTIFSAKNSLTDRFAEVWAIFFDGETQQHLALKQHVPLSDCSLGDPIRMGNASLAEKALEGSLLANDHRLAWRLQNDAGAPTLLLYPEKMYASSWPRTKVLVSRPSVTFSGTLTVDGAIHDVGGWRGSHNHVWGDRQAYLYAWGQVVGFDGYPESFLEIGTAQFKLGPLKTPLLTALVLRHKGQSFALNTPWRALTGSGAFDFFRWHFFSKAPEVRIEGSISADRQDFVALRYRNPAGGEKSCINSKIATCRLLLTYPDKKTETLIATRRAAFEILTDRADHGVSAHEHSA